MIVTADRLVGYSQETKARVVRTSRGLGYFVGVSLVLAALSTLGVYADDANVQEQSQLFDWFGNLGYPDIKDAKFVRVATTYGLESDPNSWTNHKHGFLIRDEEASFTVFFLDLSTETFEKRHVEARKSVRFSFESVDLAEFVDALLKGNLKDNEPGLPRRFGERISEHAETFVLAWCCSRKGEPTLANQLYEHAEKLPRRAIRNRQNLTFRQQLSADFAYCEMWRGILQFADVSMPRIFLLSPFERIVRRFPDSEYAERAKETVALLKKMILEDKEHAEHRKTGKPFAELTEKEQIAELIFQLRDQTGAQISQPGACNILITGERDNETAAHKLVKIGYAAVPQLIDALDDDRFSRAVGFQRGFYFSHTVLRVNDCAEQILAEIAGQSFYIRSSTDGYMHKDGATAAVRQKVTAWHRQLLEKGEMRLLIEEAERGRREAYRAGQQLVEKYPDVALPALLTGARRSTERWARTQFIESIGRLKGDAAVPFLLEEIVKGPIQSGRLAAAVVLHSRGRSEGVTAMIAEWKQHRLENDRSLRAGHSLAQFLAGSGKVEAIEALEHQFEDQSVGVRLDIVSALQYAQHSDPTGNETADAQFLPVPGALCLQ